MPAIDFARLAQWIDISENALKLLAPPEKQIILNLNIRGADGDLLTADV
jgi:hypothetical protein